MATLISIDTLKEKMDRGPETLCLIDTRSTSGFAACHIAGAKNIPSGPTFLAHFEREIGISKNAEVILYCASKTCMSSVRESITLESAGYTNVLRYEDGVAGWVEQGYACEKSSDSI